MLHIFKRFSQLHLYKYSLRSTDLNGNKLIKNLNHYKHLTTSVIPEPPPEGLCCGSGCQNCCWLVYADELLDYYQHDGGDQKAFEALKNVQDPSAREFLKMELRMKIQFRNSKK